MKPIYVALEGVKGSGKSTVFESLIAWLETTDVRYSTLCPTRKSPDFTWWETENRLRSPEDDLWREELYAYRTRYAFENADFSADLILGDRSIVTSYITRWQKWGDPQITVARVDARLDFMPAPDHIVYLNVEYRDVEKRLLLRNRDYGKHDETLRRIEENLTAYRQIRESRIVKKLRSTQWHVVDGAAPPNVVFDRAKQIVEQILFPVSIFYPALA
jgi:thymidylate kinase